MGKLVSILLLIFIIGCRKDFSAKLTIENKEGLEAIQNCQEINKCYSSAGIDTVGVSKYCSEDYKYGNLYLWECKYIDKLWQEQESLKDKIGCWHYYIDGHQFSIHNHGKDATE